MDAGLTLKRLCSDSRTWRIEYPSGNKMNLTGLLGISDDKEMSFAPMIVGADNSLHALDPRGNISDANSGVVYYSPRMEGVKTAKWVRDWLREHPEWT